MRPNFRPLCGLVIFLFLSSFALAVDKKRNFAAEAAAKAKTKLSQKADPKQQAKTSRQSNQKDDENKQQLARKKGKEGNDRQDKKSDKEVSRLAAKSREADNRKTAKSAKLAAEKKPEKDKDKSAQRERDKKVEKKEVVAKQVEKTAKSLAKSENPVAKIKPGSKVTKQESPREAMTRIEESKKSKRDLSADHSNALAKLELKAKADPKPELRYQVKEEKAKDLPAVKFPLRPIAKVLPKVELKFSVARAVSGTSFDAPPPQDHGPDVIDVFEHDSPEAGRLNEVLRSEVKPVPVSSIHSHPRKKVDVAKMDMERIKQIQEALAKKGYYVGEINGQYDDLTIEAMRRFQETHKIAVTGYATAQSLRLLGLTDW